jgi:ABC-type uncharacterized transport system substrate-binding protein
MRSKTSGFGASAQIACSAARPEPNKKHRSKAKAMVVTSGEMVIVERSSSGVSRSGPRRILMRIVFGLAAALTLVSARAEPLPRTILFLDEDTPIYPWFRDMSQAFYATIKTETANPPFVFIENLGIDAYDTADYFNIVRSHFGEKYRNKPIGVIISNASRYLQFTLRLRDELWPGTPVVLAGIQERRATRLGLPSNVTGFTFRHQLQDIVATADALIPGLKRVVLAGSRIERGGWRQDFLDDLPGVRARFEVTDLTGLSMAELRQRLAELPGDSAVVYVGFSTDVAGEHYLPAEASQLVAEAANRPTFVDSETFIGAGSVGGPVISPGGIGRVAARFALRILDGENPADIPITNSQEILRPVFDWRQLQRWGISENRLPIGSEIRFRSPTAWEQYRWEIHADFSRAGAAVALDCRSVLRTPAPPASRSGSEPPHGRAGAHEPQRRHRPDVGIDRSRDQAAAGGHRNECGRRIALASKRHA